MIVVGFIIAAIFGLAIWLGPIIVTEIKATRAAKAAVESLSENDKANLFQLIEGLGNAPSKGAIGLLVPDDLEQIKVAFILPQSVPDYPWEGDLVTVSPAFDRNNWPWPPIKFEVSQPVAPSTLSRYRVTRFCAIPAHQTPKAKKASSVLSIDRMLKLSPQLLSEAKRLHAENPTLFLATLLSPNGKWRHGNGYDEVRIGLSPQYLQEYRHHKCPKCRRPMRLIVQIPGAMIHRRLAEGTAYLLGCPSHEDETVTDYDMT
jgi:hypothetical protein